MCPCRPQGMCSKPVQTCLWHLGECVEPRRKILRLNMDWSVRGECNWTKTYQDHIFLKRMGINKVTKGCKVSSTTSWQVAVFLIHLCHILGKVPCSSRRPEAEKELDYKPTTSLQDGINKFIAWYDEYYKDVLKYISGGCGCCCCCCCCCCCSCCCCCCCCCGRHHGGRGCDHGRGGGGGGGGPRGFFRWRASSPAAVSSSLLLFSYVALHQDGLTKEMAGYVPYWRRRPVGNFCQ